jgi:23S rRNA (cytidine1920-2'-O)/16S rRNA (cytidine1409-2'-O)-methyltransferase
VRSDEIRERVVREVAAAGEGLGLQVAGVVPSPIAGARGNREILLLFRVN